MVSSKESYLRKRRHFLECTLIVNPSNVRWLTGFDSGIILMGPEDYLIVPKLEMERAKEVVKWLHVVEGPRGGLWRVAPKLCDGPFYADLSYLSFPLAMDLIRNLGAGDISKKIKELRMKKDEFEIELISRALSIAEDAFLETWKELEDGVSELEAAGMLEAHMRERGAQEFAFPTIVAFGENSAYPHAVPGRKKFSKSSVALFDFGAVYWGFRSDITRTYVPEKAPFVEWFDAVLEAINASLKVLRPGVKAKEIDEAARKVIEEYGYDQAFVHGLGHGVGADIHEPPYLSPSSEDVVPEGSVVTIEPGIYVKGIGGVRVEQLVVTKNKPLVLNKTTVVWW